MKMNISELVQCLKSNNAIRLQLRQNSKTLLVNKVRKFASKFLVRKLEFVRLFS